jgi:diguanylate cyclase (GGDEF)-like protein
MVSAMNDAHSADEPKAPPRPDLENFQVLAGVTKLITGNLKLNDVLGAIMRCLSQLLAPKHWSLLLVDERRGDLYFEIVVGEAADAIRNIRLKIGEGIAGWVAAHKEAVVASRAADDPRFSPRTDAISKFRTGSILAAALVCHDKVLGVIELVKDEGDPEPFKPGDLATLTPLADFAAIAIANARAFERVEELTIVDEWTSLYNARYLNSVLPEEVRRAERYGHELGVLFLDLDYFKSVNDTRGHAAGSTLLREVALQIKASVRETDQAIRYGGDEFVVLMPETSKTGALVMAERIRRTLAGSGFQVDTGGAINLSASIGVAAFPGDGREAKALLAAADRAMYVAKERGRNCVVDANTLPATSGA